MADIPFEILKRGEIAVANLFMPRDIEKGMSASFVPFEATFDFYGLDILGYREIPTNPAVLVEASRSTPAMRPPYRTDASFDRLLYTAKQTGPVPKTVRQRHQQGILLYGHDRHKALTRAEVLERFYLDLQSPAFVTRFRAVTGA